MECSDIFQAFLCWSTCIRILCMYNLVKDTHSQACVRQGIPQEFTKGYLGSKGTWKIKDVSPWSYPDAAAAGAAAATSAAASAVCIYYVVIGASRI